MGDRLLRDARMLPAIVARGQATEEHAARVLVDDAAGDPARLRKAALELLDDPDAVPASIALLDRAAQLAETPPPRPRRYLPPDATWGRLQ